VDRTFVLGKLLTDFFQKSETRNLKNVCSGHKLEKHVTMKGITERKRKVTSADSSVNSNFDASEEIQSVLQKAS
jgi:hypothetical protein